MLGVFYFLKIYNVLKLQACSDLDSQKNVPSLGHTLMPFLDQHRIPTDLYGFNLVAS